MSGSSADMARLRKAYESNPYEAEQLLKVEYAGVYSMLNTMVVVMGGGGGVAAGEKN